MSRYQINKLCYDLKDAANREAFTADEDAFVHRYDLDEGERSALRSRDYAAMFELGVNIYVLVTVSGLAGLRLSDLQAAMQDGYARQSS
ncbi:MAG: protocatechuate 3,4-dioxygenase [Dehalococcoidia bacterium]